MYLQILEQFCCHLIYVIQCHYTLTSDHSYESYFALLTNHASLVSKVIAGKHTLALYYSSIQFTHGVAHGVDM